MLATGLQSSARILDVLTLVRLDAQPEPDSVGDVEPV